MSKISLRSSSFLLICVSTIFPKISPKKCAKICVPPNPLSSGSVPAGESKCKKESFRSRYSNYHIVMKMRTAMSCHERKNNTKNRLQFLLCGYLYGDTEDMNMIALWNLALLYDTSGSRKVVKYLCILSWTCKKHEAKFQLSRSALQLMAVLSEISVCFPFSNGVNVVQIVPADGD